MCSDHYFYNFSISWSCVTKIQYSRCAIILLSSLYNQVAYTRKIWVTYNASEIVIILFLPSSDDNFYMFRSLLLNFSRNKNFYFCKLGPFVIYLLFFMFLTYFLVLDNHSTIAPSCLPCFAAPCFSLKGG